MPHFPPIDEQLALIQRGVEQALPEGALTEKLRRAEKTGTPLVVKLGCDPSRPDLHIGHAVVLRKLRQFQDLGHQAVLIVGDFTGMIGDPTGKSKTRPSLSLEETRANGASYFEQASAILDPEKTRIVYNSEWLGTMTFEDVIGLAATHTVAQMMEREDFGTRYAEGKPISLHEFLYPLAQAQDSVAIESDIELGGTDQTFNLLVGRAVQQARGMEPQVCLTLPLLEGTDGVEKMSKSLGNYIGIAEAPSAMYGKTLSIPDALIYRWVVLATDVPTEDLPRWKQYAEDDPRDAKHDLAWQIVKLYHGEEAAEEARAHFERTVIQRDVTQDVEDVRVAPTLGASRIGLVELIRQLGFAESNGAAKRLIKQNAVSIDDEKVKDLHLEIDLAERAPFVLKAGKLNYARVVFDG